MLYSSLSCPLSVQPSYPPRLPTDSATFLQLSRSPACLPHGSPATILLLPSSHSSPDSSYLCTWARGSSRPKAFKGEAWASLMCLSSLAIFPFLGTQRKLILNLMENLADTRKPLSRQTAAWARWRRRGTDWVLVPAFYITQEKWFSPKIQHFSRWKTRLSSLKKKINEVRSLLKQGRKYSRWKSNFLNLRGLLKSRI